MINIKESYQDLDVATVSNYVKNYIQHIPNNAESVSDITDSLNNYLAPIQVTVSNSFVGFGDWISKYIHKGSMWNDGHIDVEADVESLVNAIQFDKENNIDVKDDSDIKEFLNQLAVVIVHEFTHIYQNSKHLRDTDETTNEYDYLAQKDEIAAHAIAGVEEAYNLGYTKQDLIKKLSKKDSAFDLINFLDQTTQYARYEDELIYEDLKKFMVKYLYNSEQEND